MTDELVDKEVIRGLLIQYFTSVPSRLTEEQMSIMRHGLTGEQDAQMRTFVTILLSRDRGMSVTSSTKDTQLLVIAGGFELRDPVKITKMVASIMGIGSSSPEYDEILTMVVNRMPRYTARPANRPVPPPPPPGTQGGALPKVMVDMDADDELGRYEESENETREAIKVAKARLDAALDELGRIYGDIGKTQGEILEARESLETETDRLNELKQEVEKTRRTAEELIPRTAEVKRLLVVVQEDLDRKNTELAQLESESFEMELKLPDKMAIAQKRLADVKNQLGIAQEIMESAEHLEARVAATGQPVAVDSDRNRDDETIPVPAAIQAVAQAAEVTLDPALASQLGAAVSAKDRVEAAIESAVMLRIRGETMLREIQNQINETHEQIRTKNDEFATVLATKDGIDNDIRDCKVEIGAQVSDLKILQSNLAELEDQVVDLRRTIAGAEATIKDLSGQSAELHSQHKRDQIAYDEAVRQIEQKLAELQDARIVAQDNLARKTEEWADEKLDLDNQLARLKATANEAREHIAKETQRLGREIQDSEKEARRIASMAEERLSRLTGYLMDIHRLFGEQFPRPSE